MCETTDYWTHLLLRRTPLSKLVGRLSWIIRVSTQTKPGISMCTVLSSSKTRGQGRRSRSGHTQSIAEGMGYLGSRHTVKDRNTHGDVRVELYGNPDSDARYGYGLENKYVAVFGFLSLVGRDTLHDSHQIHTWATLIKMHRGEALSSRSKCTCARPGRLETRLQWVWPRTLVERSNALLRECYCKILQVSTWAVHHNLLKASSSLIMQDRRLRLIHFCGVPVTLWNKGSPGGRVGIYGMDDAAGALGTHMHCAVAGDTSIQGRSR